MNFLKQQHLDLKTLEVPMRYLPLTLLSLLVACDRSPVEPVKAVSAALPAARSEFTTVIDFVDDPSDCSANPRVGEVMLFTGQITYVEHTTATTSGNVNVSWYFNYDPKVHLVGQTSGTVWLIDATSTHPTGHTNLHGDGLSFENTGDEFYTSEDGRQLHLRVNEHVTQDANGNVTVTRPFVWECIGG